MSEFISARLALPLLQAGQSQKEAGALTWPTGAPRRRACFLDAGKRLRSAVQSW